MRPWQVAGPASARRSVTHDEETAGWVARWPSRQVRSNASPPIRAHRSWESFHAGVGVEPDSSYGRCDRRVEVLTVVEWLLPFEKWTWPRSDAVPVGSRRARPDAGEHIRGWVLSPRPLHLVHLLQFFSLSYYCGGPSLPFHHTSTNHLRVPP